MRVKHVATYVAAGAMTAAAAAMITVAPANAADKWAAIAYSPADEVFGWSNFNDSEHDAQSRAAFDCKGKGGTSCQVAVWIANGCVALADNERQWAVGPGPDIATAESTAAAPLGGLPRIMASTCSG